MLLENERIIGASPTIVWDVTINVERWPQWTPTVETLERLDEGEFTVGSTVRIKQPGLPVAVWQVTSLTPGKSFVWETQVRGMRMIATHELTPVKNGTSCTLRLRITGIVALLLWPFIRSSARESLEKENSALQVECENR